MISSTGCGLLGPIIQKTEGIKYYVPSLFRSFCRPTSCDFDASENTLVQMIDHTGWEIADGAEYFSELRNLYRSSGLTWKQLGELLEITPRYMLYVHDVVRKKTSACKN
jgi:hypothetical protein